MASTSVRLPRYLTRLLMLCAFGLILSACGSFDKKKGGATEEPPAANEQAGEEKFERIPNPYDLQSQEVPADAQRRFEEALALIQGGSHDQALTLLQQLVEDYPKLSGPHVNIGLIHWRQARPEQAEESFRRAIEVNKLNIDAYNQLAIMQRERGEFEQAESLYLQALEIWPHSLQSHRNLGILYDLYLGQLEKAMQHYEMAAKLSDEENRELQGWIIDLQRRLNSEEE